MVKYVVVGSLETLWSISYCNYKEVVVHTHKCGLL